jgi:hypothetical protein
VAFCNNSEIFQVPSYPVQAYEDTQHCKGTAALIQVTIMLKCGFSGPSVVEIALLGCSAVSQGVCCLTFQDFVATSSPLTTEDEVIMQTQNRWQQTPGGWMQLYPHSPYSFLTW